MCTAAGGTSEGRRPVMPWTMPPTRRHSAPATSMYSRGNSSSSMSGPWGRRGARRWVGGSNGVERALRRLTLRAVGRDLHHLLPRLQRAVEILLAKGFHDAHVEQRLHVFRIERQRMLELFERLIRLIRVVVAHAEIGADIDIAGTDFQR